MDKTHNISLGGFSFVIENNAADHLSSYLTKVRQSLGDSSDTEEILFDVEQRMAELLKARIQNTEVVTLSDITYLIEIMGQPEQYVETDGDTQSQKFSPRRKLYRDIDRKNIGGVLSGLSYYFRIDVTLLRIIYILSIILNLSFLQFHFNGTILSFSSFSILLYVILWIIVPPAKTTAEKLEMQGIDVNIDTLSSYKTINSFPKEKQWFRSSSNKMVAGVLGGLAKYLSIEATWLRIGFVFFVLLALISTQGRFFHLILLYGILAFALKKDNANSLEENTSEDKENKKDKKEETFSQLKHSRSILGDLFHLLFKGAGYFLVMIFLFVVFILILVAFSAILSLGIFSGVSFALIYSYIDFFLVSWQQYLFFLLSGLFVVLFFSLFTLLAIKVFSRKGYHTPRWWFMGNILIALCTFLGVFSLVTSLSKDFVSYNTIEKEYPINTSSDTLFIQEKRIAFWQSKFVVDKKGNAESGDTEFLKIVPTQRDTPYLIVKISSNGKDSDDAIEKAQEIEYPIEIDGNTIKIPNGYRLKKGHLFRFQKVYVQLFVPSGKKVIFETIPLNARKWKEMLPYGIFQVENDEVKSL